MAGLGQENAPSVFLQTVFRQGIVAGVIEKQYPVIDIV